LTEAMALYGADMRMARKRLKEVKNG